MMHCFDLIAPSGKIIFVGLFQGEVKFNDPNFHRRELTILATRNASCRTIFARIIAMIEAGAVEYNALDHTPHRRAKSSRR